MLVSGLLSPSAAFAASSVDQRLDQLEKALAAQQRIIDAQQAEIQSLRAQVGSQQAAPAQADLAATVEAQKQDIAQLKEQAQKQKLQAADQPKLGFSLGRPTISSPDGRFTFSPRLVVQADFATYDQAAAGPLATEPAVWREVFEVNVTGAFLGARAAARVMVGGGRLILTGSVLGERPARGLAAYSASKAALVGMAKSLALDLASQGITVNVVAPGWFDSPLAASYKANPKLEAGVLGHTAQRRWGAPTDLAGAYQFLASDASAFVTGTVLAVDGGYLLT